MVEAFGTVYKGILPSGSGNSVAEKKLEKVVGEDEKEFKAEVNVIGQLTIRIKDTSCVTVVRVNTEYWCFFFMHNGSLSRFLSGGAQGLVYLHEECSKQIIHCDIKPSEHNSWMILL